jgi:hypothetical protein
MSDDDQQRPAWWGQYSLDVNQTALWEIGPLKLAIQRRIDEWQIAYESVPDVGPDTTIWQFQPAVPDIETLDYANIARYARGETDEAVWLRPLLADRPLVSRPVTPLYVPAGEIVIIFVRSSLWLRVEVGDALIALQEVPMLRPSDTWFGPTTMEGELCYASQTYARLNLEKLPIGPHHAVTQVTIQNQADSQLLVERLKLPVPYLALFESSDGLLWTQGVTMTRSRDTDMADVQIEPSPPEHAGVVKLLSDPRQATSIKTAIYAFGALFGG